MSYELPEAVAAAERRLVARELAGKACGVEPERIFDPRLRRLLAWVGDERREGREPARAKAAAELGLAELELLDLVGVAPGAGHRAADDARLVTDEAKRREAHEAGIPAAALRDPEAQAKLELALSSLRTLDVADDIASGADRVRRVPGHIAAGLAGTIRTGVKFIDDATRGMRPGDVFILSAPTGGGKTEAAAIIASNIVRQGGVVGYLALEAEQDEIESRQLYRALVDDWYQTTPYDDRGRLSRRLNYADWRTGRLAGLLGRHERDVTERLAEDLAGLRTVYRLGRDFTCTDLERTIRALGRVDAIVLDHLHYIDVDDDEGENRGMKRVLKKIRDLAQETQTPLLLVAHVRKADRRIPTLIPSIEDVHGSSDVVKIATAVIMLARGPEDKALKPWQIPTLMQCGKVRLDGSVSRYVALTTFDIRNNSYDADYLLGRCKGDEWKPIDAKDAPWWATTYRQAESTDSTSTNSSATAGSERSCGDDR